MRLNDLAKKDNTWKNRAVSLLMAGTMVLGSLWIGPSKYTEAAEDEGVGVLTLSELPEYTLTKTTLNGALIVDDSGRTCEATELSKIVIQGTSDAQPSVEITGEVGNASTVVEITGDYASLQVKSGGTLNAASVQGYLAYNYGTVNAGTLNLSVSGAEKEFGNEGKLTVAGDLSIDSSMGTLENTGEIHANGLNLNSTFTLNNSSTGSIEINSLSLYENGEDYAEIVNEGSIAIPAFNSSAFPEQAFTNKGTVTCDDAALTTQVLNYSSAVYDVKDSYSMSGFNSEPPWTVKAQPMTTITMDGGGFDLIVGTNDSVSVSGNYENRYAFEFLEELNYSHLSEFEKAEGNDYLKVTGLSNGRYVKDKLTFTPKEGYLTMCSHSAPYSFAESFDLKKSDIYIDNPGGTPFYNQDVMVSIADTSTGKHVTADLISAVPSLEDTYQNLVFDDTPPQVFITSAKADGQDIAIDTGDDDVEITARQLVLQLDILDENLDMTAEVNEEEVTIQDGATADDPKTLTITYDTDPEELEDNLSYTIRDLAGNETHFSIHLVYAQETTTGTFSVDDIAVGEAPTLSLSTTPEDIDEVIYEIKLKSAADSEYQAYEEETPIDAAGVYTIRATIEETGRYTGLVKTADFTVSRLSGTGEISIPSTITYGTEYAPTVITESTGTVTFAYKPSGTPEDAYTVTKPVYAGTYDVRATVSETDTYEGFECYGTFTIKKKVVTATVTVADVTIGEPLDPQVTTDSDGTVTFRYKSDAAGAEYSDAVPTAAGKYYVEATVAETDTYESIVCESTSPFTIKKKIATATLTVNDITIGETIDPQVTTDSNGTVIFRYKSDAAGAEYSDTIPTAAGTYYAQAIISETDEYEAITCISKAFTISKKTPATATVTVADILVGETPDPQVTTDSNGTVTFKYKSDAEGAKYIATVPTAAGTYYVQATIAETDEYDSITCVSAAFTISKKTPATATVTVADILVGETPDPQVTTDSNGTVTFRYKRDAEGAKYTATVPTAAGTYYVQAIIAETDEYDSITCTSEAFKISRKTVTATVTVADVEIGETITPVVTTESDGKNTATFLYKPADAPETAYSSTVPVQSGRYSVRAIIPETDTYNSIVCEGTFKIRKKTPSYATVTVPNVQVGQTVEATVDTDSDGKKDAKLEFKAYDAPDSGYDQLYPIAVGRYSVRATIPETENYEAIVCENSFYITAKPVAAASVTVADIEVGGRILPKLTTEHDGKNLATYQYKQVMAAEASYTTTEPAAADIYMLRVIIPETTNYAETICECRFTIYKKNATASVSVADLLVGETVTPKVTTGSDGTPTFEYKEADAADAAYSSTVPAAAGKYSVRATISETETYHEVTCENTFTISKRTAKVTVNATDILVGEKVKPVVDTDSDGAAAFEYKVEGAEDTTFTDVIPTAAGTYVIRATIAETETYKKAVDRGTFIIGKHKPVSAKVTAADILVGETVNPEVTSDSDGAADATFVYKASGAADSTFSTSVPTTAGSYVVRATVPETARYLSITCEGSFTVRRKKAEVRVSLDNPYAGTTYSPKVTTESNGTVTYEYRTNTENSQFSLTQPKSVGRYIVRVTVTQTDMYEAVSGEAEYEVIFLDEPQTPYSVAGTEGKNNYYTEDVTLDAPEGYLISATPDGEYTTSIPYVEGMTKVYLKRTDDDALTDEIRLGEILIDKEAPVLEGIITDKNNPVTYTEGAEIYADTLKISLVDKNLAYVWVGKFGAAVTDGRADIVLSANGDYNTYTITAEDIAGNTYKLTFTLLAAWRLSDEVPPGMSVTLETGKRYTFGDGNWKVEGEATIYSGGQAFYVTKSRKYTLSQE